MKPRHYLPIALLSAILTACGGGNNTKTTGNANSEAQADAKPQTSTEQPAAQQPAKKTLPFLTQDLRMYNFFGKVKTFKTIETITDANQKPQEDPSEDWFTLEYDADGHFVKNVSIWAEKTNIKSKDGDKITKTETPIADFGDEPVIVEYEYDSNGLVKTTKVQGIEGKSSTEYTYNDDGELVKEVEKASGEGSVSVTERTYTIIDRDANKNWTKRFVKTTFKEGDDDGSGKFGPEETSYMLQTRTITYWE